MSVYGSVLHSPRHQDQTRWTPRQAGDTPAAAESYGHLVSIPRQFEVGTRGDAPIRSEGDAAVDNDNGNSNNNEEADDIDQAEYGLRLSQSRLKEKLEPTSPNESPTVDTNSRRLGANLGSTFEGKWLSGPVAEPSVEPVDEQDQDSSKRGKAEQINKGYHNNNGDFIFD